MINMRLQPKIIKVLTVILCLSVGFIYGVGFSHYHWPPYRFIKATKNALTDQAIPGFSAKPAAEYTIKTSRLSYFALDDAGLYKKKNGFPYRSEGEYIFHRPLHPHKTAIVVMDPWADMPEEALNIYYGEIVKKRIVPLLHHAIRLGHPIFILTHDPGTVKYNTRIAPQLADLVVKKKAVELYHEAYDDDRFAELLMKNNINALIYVGFASNMCILGSKKMGMVPMRFKGFHLFFIPEASAAAEYGQTWKDGTMHKYTTMTISQWLAEIIHYDDFMKSSIN